MNEKKYYSGNLLYPIIKFNNEYYIVCAAPHFWHIFLGPMRSVLFSYRASKIPPEELEKYKMEDKKISFKDLGLTSLFTGITAYLSVSLINMKEQIPSSLAIFILVLGYIVLFLVFTYFYHKGGFNKLDTYDYKVRFRPKLTKENIKGMLVITVLQLFAFGMNALIIMEFKKELFPANQIFIIVFMIIFYLTLSITMYGDDYGTTRVVQTTKKKELGIKKN